MASARPSSRISSESDLASAIGATDSYSIEDWLQNRCEFVDGFDDDGGEQAFRRVLFFAGSSVHAQYTIDLPYPFKLGALEDAADRAEHYFRAVMSASFLNKSDAMLGSLGGEHDVTEDFADEIFGSAKPEDVAAALNGPWQSIDFGVRMDYSGEEIHAWFVPTDDRRVALGIGAVNLFVVPLRGSDTSGYWVEEWPAPSVNLWAGWRDGVNQTDPDDCVRQLAEAIETSTDRFRHCM